MEVNGWAIVREHYHGDEHGRCQRSQMMDGIRDRVDTQGLRERTVALRFINGDHVVLVSLDTEHYDDKTDRVIALFEFIGQTAPGSYGKLHIRDPEGRFGDPNVMHLILLARGSITRTVDPFFTPVVPKITDPVPGQHPKLSELRPKYLPIGTVVTLNNADKKLMIFGHHQRDTANDTEFDYAGCPYPEGNIGPKATFLFNHDDIGWIHFLGLADAGPQSWVNHPVPQSDSANTH